MSDSFDPMDYSPLGSFSLGFSRQEHWSGLPFSSPGDLPDPGIEPGSPALQADSLLTELGGKPHHIICPFFKIKLGEFKHLSQGHSAASYSNQSLNVDPRSPISRCHILIERMTEQRGCTSNHTQLRD